MGAETAAEWFFFRNLTFHVSAEEIPAQSESHARATLESVLSEISADPSSFEEKKLVATLVFDGTGTKEEYLKQYGRRLFAQSYTRGYSSTILYVGIDLESTTIGSVPNRPPVFAGNGERVTLGWWLESSQEHGNTINVYVEAHQQKE